MEVPVLASRKGLSPIRVGPLPCQVAPLVALNAQIEEMVVAGALTGDRDLLRQALYYDPLSSAVCSLAEIRKMFDEMWQANAPYLDWFGGSRYTFHGGACQNTSRSSG